MSWEPDYYNCEHPDFYQDCTRYDIDDEDQDNFYPRELDDQPDELLEVCWESPR
jgi:hypothetical protein